MEPVGDYEYSKKDLIGHGAFAVVFKGRQRKKPEHVVAIKCITKKNLAKSQSLLSKEINILKELSGLHHENVVALLDCKETSHHVYLVMEYCNGGDLADYLQVKGTLSEDTIALFFRHIAAAMKALNAKGIVHRDLKPQNILLCHSGRPNPLASEMRLKIADFGFARFLQDGVMAATLCGSPMYMAPEVIMSLQYDAKADLWSVGTIMYQCLTGKAPFQAQTPQQLKQFYEKNANLQPIIPSGTSRDIRHLLMRLLKRNAKERMEFDDFFTHPFLNPKSATKPSSPVPVPRNPSRHSLGESPNVKTVTASPLSGNISSPSPSSNPDKSDGTIKDDQPVPADSGSLHEAGSFCKVEKSEPSAAVTEDYVLVPENVSSHHSGCEEDADATPVQSKVIPCSSPKAIRAAGKSEPVTSGNSATPSRPSTLSCKPSPPSGSTEPIPVPSQIRAYEQIQRSIGFSPSSPYPPANTPSPASPSPRFQTQPSPKNMSAPVINQTTNHTTNQPTEGEQNPKGMAIPRKNSTSSLRQVGSISPPSVQFTIGTPPGPTWRRNSNTSTPPAGRTGITPPLSSSPLKKNNTVNLPSIAASPIKTPTGFNFTCGEIRETSPSSPLQAPFGSLARRTQTCPINIDATEGQPLVRKTTDPSLDIFHRSSSATVLTEPLLRAFTGQMSNPNTFTRGLQSPPGKTVIPYTANQNSPAKDINTSCQQNHPTDGSPSSAPYAQSPPNMQGPIMFVPPELAEETLMEKEHNETVSKLNFVLALVECVIELAQARSSPLSESLTGHPGGGQRRPSSDDTRCNNTFTLQPGGWLSDGQRRLEQMVLYVRALQLLSSSLQLGRTELKAGRLSPSVSVQAIVKDMNSYYHQCLAVCKVLHNKSLPNSPQLDPKMAAITADKLIYTHAIEMCQTAALDELFGNPSECFRRYRSAQILLHSLAQQAEDDTDRTMLNKYKESVERRLYNLHEQGYIQVNVSDSVCSTST